MNVRLMQMLIIAIVGIVPFSEAACTGNSLGQCAELTPNFCVIERLVIGTSLTETQDIEVGRTSFSRYPVPFVHDGGIPDFLPSTFAVTALPSSPSDAGSSINEADCEGSVTVFFNTSERKTIRVRAFQDVFNRTATSSNAMIVTFDQQPPSIQPQQVFEGQGPNESPLSYSAGRTYYTSNEIFVTGRIIDPAPSAPADQLSVQVVGGLAESGGILAGTGESPGFYAIPLGLEQEQVDGEYLVELVAWDTANANAAFDDGSPANRSEVVVYKVVKDTSEPVMTKLEIIRNPNTSDQTIQEAPGVFVKRETIQVRASFSETLKTPPRLSVTQIGSGVGTPPDPYFAIFDPDLFQSSPNEVTYSLTPQAGLKDIGQVDFLFEGGSDLAGNPLSLTEGVFNNGGELSRALIVDTIPPDLNRIQEGAIGVIQSDPANGEKIPESSFPSELTIIVKDYDLPDNLPEDSGGDISARGNSSGVDFSRIFDSGAGANDDVIQVELFDPRGEQLLGTLATKPPNGLVYILPPEDELFVSRIAPEGNYTVQVTLVDKVGNVSNESFSFEVDNTDIQSSSIQVAISPVPGIDDDFVVDSGNPLLKKPISGELIPDSPFLKNLENLDSIRQLDSIEVCSNDSSMNLTRSQVFLKARLNGPDTVARVMNTTTVIDVNANNGVCEVNGLISLVAGDQSDVFPAFNFGFPNPSNIGAGVIEGSRDPRFGLYDGPYSVEIVARDDAGNLSDPILKEFLLDTTPPFTRQVFPAENSKVNAPLQHFSAILEDPHPPKLHVLDEDSYINFGSGISVEYSGMNAQLVTPYRPEDLDTTLFDINNNNEIKGRLSYVHRPNSFDASLATFSPEDDYYRVLLEFIDEQGNSRSLPLDGSADGIYSLIVTPVDNAGNSIDGALAGQSGWRPISNPDQIPSQELKKSFSFLLDTIAPNLKVDTPVNQLSSSKIIVSGGSFNISGTAKDLSAQRATPGNGGAGMKQVDWELVFLNPDGSLVQPDNSQEGTTSSAVKKNPIVTGLANLAEIVDLSKDPTLDVSRPLKSAEYGNIVLEERVWRIDGELPPFAQIITATDSSSGSEAKYFLRIYARDLAGNIAMESIEMVINQGDLFAPDLVEPILRESLNSTAVNFEWKAVPNAADYVLYISKPSGELTTFVVNPTGESNDNIKTLQILNMNGDYQWWVKARDSIGNEGNESLRQSFTIDTVAPQVNLVTWMDISPDTIPTITRGQFVIRITFDGDLKNGPDVHFQPFLSSIPKQKVVTYNLTKNVWEGRAQIPESADNSWDGQAILHIENAADLAGNSMIIDRTHAFEIETGPTFSVRFFENPVANDELTLIIRSTEILSGDPIISMPRNLELLNERPLKIDSQTYSTNLKLLESTLDGIGEITIVGQDLLGNTASRIVTFAMNSIDGDGGGSVFNSRLRLDMKPGSFAGRYNVAILPASELEISNQHIGISASLLKSSRSRVLGSIYPTTLNLLNPVDLAIQFQNVLEPKTGLFINSAGNLYFLADVSSTPKGEWRTVQLDVLGSLVIASDRIAPKVTIPYDLTQETFSGRKFSMELKVEDDLSGLDLSSIKAELNSNKLVSKVDVDGNVTLESRNYFPGGDSELIFEASDRMGNRIVQKSMVIIAGPLKIQFNSYPNPASSFATLEYRLSQAVKSVRIKIYDSASRLIFSSNSQSSLDLPTHGGTHEFDWSLINQKGSEVSNGVYVAQLIVQDQAGISHKLRTKIAVIR